MKKKVFTCLLALASAAVTVGLLVWCVFHVGLPAAADQTQSVQAALMDEYDRYINNQVSQALDGVLKIDKVYWLNDSDQIAPKPDPDKFGTVSDPKDMQPILDQAKELLDGQETCFRTDMKLQKGTNVSYYLDDTILSISWCQRIGKVTYTFSEIKIAHPSQFRRFLADGQYGSNKQYYCTQMAATVNAVTAANADFYKYRTVGSVVYNGQVYRANAKTDTCYINDQGKLLMVPRNTLKTKEELEAYVKENNVRFSISFGPILIVDGENVVPDTYRLGNINAPFSRAGLGELGDLHYLVVTAGWKYSTDVMPTMKRFANTLLDYGCINAYAMDGGQTGTIVTNGKVKNFPDFGTQRQVSDIIYFATALPDGGEGNG